MTGFHPNPMKRILLFLLLVILTASSHAQIANGLYIGLEKMSWPHWYHENLLLADNDSIFIYKSPVEIINHKKTYSASDGAFYYYYGTTTHTDTANIVHLIRHNCDYCGMRVKIDTATGFRFPIADTATYRLYPTPGGFTLNKVAYHKSTLNPKQSFPPRQVFYPDSNNIYRIDPKGQYRLISTAIKNFLETKTLTLDHDTLRICLDRINQDSLVEKMDSNNIRPDTANIVLRFYALSEIKKLTSTSSKPIRYIQVGEIIDYWKAARISLTYTIAMPKTIHHFSERQYNTLLEYEKREGHYVLTSEPAATGWQLVEQK
jgi:hypothetical protein